MAQHPVRSCVVILLCFSVLLTGCNLFSARTCDPAQSSAQLPVLPSSAHTLETQCDLLFYQTTFTMNAGDLAEFQATTPITDWRTEHTSAIFADPPFADQAARATDYLYGEFSDGANLIVVLIDRSDVAQYTVYYRADFVD